METTGTSAASVQILDRHSELYLLRRDVPVLVQAGDYPRACHRIVQTMPKLYTDRYGYSDLLAMPNQELRLGFRNESDHVTLLDSLFSTVREHQRSVLRFMQKEMPHYRAGLNLLALHLFDSGDLIQALEVARASFQGKQNCVFTESVVERIVKRLRDEGKLGETQLSDTEQTMLKSFERFLCPKAFSNFEVYRTGEVFVCCGSLVPASIGNVFEQDFGSIWNSERAQEIRRSIHDGSYRYCSRTCPNLRADTLPTRSGIEVLPEAASRDARIAKRQLVVLDDGPEYVNLANDYTCNLSCPSCRRGMRSADSKRREVLDQVYERGIRPLLDHVRILQIAGDGDPFASKHYRQILAALSREKYPKLKLRLLTNGVLLDQEEWLQFSNIHPLLDQISISIDAATAETYAVVRRGGDWDRLMANLEHLAERRRDGAFPFFNLNFVVQQRNFREMPQFVELGRKLSVDQVIFVAVHNQTEAFTGTEFRCADVTDPSHSEFEEFQAMLHHPLLRDPIVRFGFPLPKTH
ncbi:MAG: radical SAM protein [Bdellovibrionota bacterium]